MVFRALRGFPALFRTPLPNTASRNSPPGRNIGVLVAGIFTASPVCGFLPVRGARLLRSNVPNPDSETLWPLATVSLMVAMEASTTLATEALAMSVRLATSETRPRLFTIASVYVGEAQTGCATKGSRWVVG